MVSYKALNTNTESLPFIFTPFLLLTLHADKTNIHIISILRHAVMFLFVMSLANIFDIILYISKWFREYHSLSRLFIAIVISCNSKLVSLYVFIVRKYITKIQRMSEGKSHKNKRKAT